MKGLTGFLVPIPQREIIPGYNDVSMFEHASWPKLMLGGVSFVTSSYKENLVYVPNRNKTKVCIRVTAIKGIQKGKEITVNYGVEYFGPNRMFCECPHSAYHGPNAAVINSWTRSAKVKPICTANLNVLNGTATTATPIANKNSLCTPMTQSKRQIKPRSNLS